MQFLTYSEDKSFSITARNGNDRLIANIPGGLGSFSFATVSHYTGLWTEFYGWLNDWRFTYMARRMNTSVEFVNIRVEKSHESDFLAWYEEMLPDIGDHLLILVSSNYKVSLNLDLTNDCYIVAVTGTSENRDNRGLCMTSRSNVLFEAIGLALYKHEVLCGGSSWGEPEERQTNWG